MENFTDTTCGKLHQHHLQTGVAMNTLRKMKPVKTALSNTHFVQITKPNLDLV
jgi:hypothetical protein